MATCLLSELKLDIAFGIYVMSNLKMDVALLYCRMNGADDLAMHRRHLENRYLAEDVEEIVNVEGALGKWRKIRSTVNQWLVEYNLNEWINKINHTAGVAPSFDSVFEKYRCLRQETNMPEDRYDRYDCRKKWVQRYMQKWSASRKSIVTHEANSTAEVVKKVRTRKNHKKKHTPETSLCSRFGGRFSAPKLEPFIRMVKETGSKKRPQNWDHKFSGLVCTGGFAGSNFLAVATAFADESC
jgi:hypothetical protein